MIDCWLLGRVACGIGCWVCARERISHPKPCPDPHKNPNLDHGARSTGFVEQSFAQLRPQQLSGHGLEVHDRLQGFAHADVRAGVQTGRRRGEVGPVAFLELTQPRRV